MSIPESPIPPQALMASMEGTKLQVVATIAAAVVAASGKPHSIQQVLDIARDVQFALWPAPGYGLIGNGKKQKTLS
jgi:hypothetical protein